MVCLFYFILPQVEVIDLMEGRSNILILKTHADLTFVLRLMLRRVEN